MREATGRVFILVGPSGAGKNTLVAAVLDHISGLAQMPTATTRAPRPNEIPGREHLFLTDSEFDSLVREAALVEWQLVHGSRYGIVRNIVEQHINSGTDCVADIEVLGAQRLRDEYPGSVSLIFVAPPSRSELARRIRGRGAESDAQIDIRLSRASWELQFIPQCDYLIVNDELEQATTELTAIVLAEASRKRVAQARSSGLAPHNYHMATTGVVLDRGRRSALFVRRDYDPLWYLPGGHVGPGELPHEALLRRVREETGYEVELATAESAPHQSFHGTSLVRLPDWLRFEDLGRHHHLDFVYICNAIQQPVEVVPNKEHKWFSMSRIESFATPPNVRRLIQSVKKRLGRT